MKTVLVAATPDLSDSIDFYSKLQFHHQENNGVHYFMDSGVSIEIDGWPKTRSGIKFYKEDWTTEVTELRKLTEVIESENGFILNDFSGIRIQLVEDSSPIVEGQNREVKSVLGNYAGLSLEGISIRQLFSIYEILGFKKTMGSEDGGWMSVANEEDFTISMMSAGACPHMFYNPSLSYFNSGENLKVIARIRALEIPITEEITVFNKEGIVDNIILRDPGGFGFFVFND